MRLVATERLLLPLLQLESAEVEEGGVMDVFVLHPGSKQELKRKVVKTGKRDGKREMWVE